MPYEDAADAVTAALAEVDTPADRKVEAQARRTRAVSMALAGLTYEQIGDALGITAHGAVELVKRTIEDTRNYSVDALRAVENARLDRAQAAIWNGVLSGEAASVSAFLRISERRAKMNGLDAPTKIQMAVSVRREMELALESLQEVILDAEIVAPTQDVVEAESRRALSHDYLIDPMESDDRS